MTKKEAISILSRPRNMKNTPIDILEAHEMAIKALEQEPTTKNNLGVDCISREDALVAIRNLYPSMPRVDFNGSLRKWADKYKPYIECEDAIEELSPVTPIRPKGHWISRWHAGHDLHFHVCSECNEEFSCDMETGISIDDYRYCPNCGSYNGGASNGNE